MSDQNVRPVRLQRKRTKGSRMPEWAVYVGRPGPFGNQFRVGSASCNVMRYRKWITHPSKADLLARVRRELRGRDLACWCAPGSPCHADVLLSLANDMSKETTNA